MTSAYKLLINESDATLIKRDNEFIEIAIKNPKNIAAYEIWNSEISNSKTKKIFTLSCALVIEAINNYNNKVFNKRGFIYTPTASVVLDISADGISYGGLLYIDNMYLSETNDTLYIRCLEKHDLFVEEVDSFPDYFKGKIRININGFQSTGLINVVDNNFLNWLDPVYDRISPFPYIEHYEESLENRKPPAYNFLVSDLVSIKRQGYNTSVITIKNPNSVVFYEIWSPLTNKLNAQETMEGSIEPAQKFYSLFRKLNDKILNTPGADKDKQLFLPTTSFDLIDKNGTSYSLLGTLIDVNTNFETGENTISFTVDSSNYLVYPNNRIQNLPQGEFYMFMEIDGVELNNDIVTSNNYTLPEIKYFPKGVNGPQTITELTSFYYNFNFENPGQGEKIGIMTAGTYWPLFTTLSQSKQQEKLNKLKELFRQNPGLENYNPKITIVSNLTQDDYSKIFPQPFKQSVQDDIEDTCFEAMLDLNMVSFLLPNISEIIIYIVNVDDFHYNEEGLINNDSLDLVLSNAIENNINVLTWSYSLRGSLISLINDKDDDNLFRKIIDSNISMCVSTGDEGGVNGPNYASLSKYAIAVGGTAFNNVEGVPTNGWEGSTGGISNTIKSFESQKALTGSDFRQVPDISAWAQPVWFLPVTLNSQYTIAGGTSASCPLTASLLVCINQARKRVNKQPLKNKQFVNALYNNYDIFSNDEIIFDVVEGNSKAHVSVIGYDNVTGLGSLADVKKMLNYFVENVD